MGITKFRFSYQGKLIWLVVSALLSPRLLMLLLLKNGRLKSENKEIFFVYQRELFSLIVSALLAPVFFALLLFKNGRLRSGDKEVFFAYQGKWRWFFIMALWPAAWVLLKLVLKGSFLEGPSLGVFFILSSILPLFLLVVMLRGKISLVEKDFSLEAGAETLSFPGDEGA